MRKIRCLLAAQMNLGQEQYIIINTIVEMDFLKEKKGSFPDDLGSGEYFGKKYII